MKFFKTVREAIEGLVEGQEVYMKNHYNNSCTEDSMRKYTRERFLEKEIYEQGNVRKTYAGGFGDDGATIFLKKDGLSDKEKQEGMGRGVWAKLSHAKCFLKKGSNGLFWQPVSKK